MKKIWSIEIDAVLECGIFLGDSGIKNWILTSQQALNAIHELKLKGVAILGGDVYMKIGNNFESNYDNWYCDKLINEKQADFVIRSVNCAVKYIQTYNGDHNTYFTLVPLLSCPTSN